MITVVVILTVMSRINLMLSWVLQALSWNLYCKEPNWIDVLVNYLINEHVIEQQVPIRLQTKTNYSPAAIIRNAKIWNIILLLAFFPNVRLKSEFRKSCSVRRKLFEESTTTALTPNLLGISTFLGFLKSGGNSNGVTAMWRPIYLYLIFYR